MTQQQSSNSVALVQQALLDDKDFLKILVEKTLQSILDNEFDTFLGASPYSAQTSVMDTGTDPTTERSTRV